MLLKPITGSQTLSLSDKDANAPKSLAKGDQLKELLDAELEKLTTLQDVFYASRKHALLVVLQGRDASGKDGTIRQVFGACNPLGCTVTGFKAPTELELSHDYLWRVHNAVPPKGMIGIFNRSHYEDVLVVRVRELAPKAVWSKRYDQINHFERHLAENGVIILKFFLHVSRDEQKEQFLERLEDPTKNWKFRAGDLEDRGRWDDYTSAYRDALRKCSTSYAPWFLVPGDNRLARNYLITRVVNDRLQRLGLEYPRVSPEVMKLAKTLR